MTVAGPVGVSATEADWSRERKRFFQWSPSRSLLASIRAYQHWRARRGLHAVLLRHWATLRHRIWSVVTGADIPCTTRIGGGLLLPHPNGVVVHADAEIGPNCLLFQQVTLGQGAGGAPRLGGHVDVGAGAKVLGSISIGDHSWIGANAVVTTDVPQGGNARAATAEVRGPRAR